MENGDKSAVNWTHPLILLPVFCFGDSGNDWLYADLADLLVDGGTGTNTIYGRPRIPLPVGR